jgi:hypothetical protein
MSNSLDDFISQAEAAYDDGLTRTNVLFGDIEAKLREMESLRVKLNRIAPMIGKELRPETTLRTIPVGTVPTPVAAQQAPVVATIPGARVPRSALNRQPRAPRQIREPSVGKLREATGDEDQGFEKDE